MQLKRSAALAAAAIAAAGAVSAAQFGAESNVPAGRVVVPSLSVPEVPSIGTMGVPQLQVPTVDAGLSAVSAMSVMPSVSIAAPAVPAARLAEAAHVSAALAGNENVKVIVGDAKGDGAKGAALSKVYDNGAASVSEGAAVSVAAVSPAVSGLTLPSAAASRTPASMGIARLGYGSYSAANAGLVDLMKRAYNVMLGWLGMGVKKMETPEVMAQRLIDELNAEGPKLNKLVADASKQVELLRMQVSKDEAESQRLDGLVNQALKMGKDDAASSLESQKDRIDQGLATNKEQLAHAEQTLTNMKKHRDDFFYERQQKIRSIQAKLGEVKAAQMNKELAKLEASFGVGDKKDLEDKFNQAADEAIAEGKGMIDSAESSAENQMKEIERAAQNDSVKDKLAERRKKLGLDGSGTTPDKK